MTAVRTGVSMLILSSVLRLPEFMEITDISVDHEHGVLMLTVDVPDAPAGAVAMEPSYTRARGWPDPVTLTDITWRDADGREIKP